MKEDWLQGLAGYSRLRYTQYDFIQELHVFLGVPVRKNTNLLLKGGIRFFM